MRFSTISQTNLPVTESKLQHPHHEIEVRVQIPYPICEVIKFPTPRDDRGTKAVGGSASYTVAMVIIYVKQNGHSIFSNDLDLGGRLNSKNTEKQI